MHIDWIHDYSRSRVRGLRLGVWLGVYALLWGGCQDQPKPAETPSSPLAGTRVRLLVVGDPELAVAAARLRGEWQAQSGSDFEIAQMTEEQFQQAIAPQAGQAAKPAGEPPATLESGTDGGSVRPAQPSPTRIEHDAILAPSYLVGLAAQRKAIAPLARKDLQATTGRWAEIYEMDRLHDARWGEKDYGISLGAPVLVCYCRADLLARLNRPAPRTWAEYQELAELLHKQRPAQGPGSDAAKSAWLGAAEPLGPGWAGLTLLARAACYAKHPDNYSSLFRIDDMQPLVDGPPFVRALQELVAAAKLGPRDARRMTPAEVRAAFWQGRCGMALTWPTAAQPLPDKAAPSWEVLFAELPGSPEVYNLGAGQWQARAAGDEGRVPMLGLAGRTGMVCAGAKVPGVALELLSWLSAAQPEHPLAAASWATTVSRSSQEKWPQVWTEKPAGEAAAQYVSLVKQIQQHQQWLGAPRIPGRSEYLAALDQAVADALSGTSAAAALHQAAEGWRRITERLGRESQQAAYLRSVELEP